MNFSPPQWIKDAASEALSTVAANHYSHPKGRMRLREAIRDYYSPVFGRQLDVENEILVTSGANEGQYTVIVPNGTHRLTCVSYRSILRPHRLPQPRR